MDKINREDMLELTRRMTVKRNILSRIAGAYMDEEGDIEGTFNIHFLKLSPKEQSTNLRVAKAIPFAETNVKLKEYPFSEEDKQPGGIRQLLMALKECELKNDALLEVLYEQINERYHSDGGDYGIYIFYGSYDIPVKASDKESLWESEEVYQFIIGAVCPVHGDYEPEEPTCGFLFPALKDHSGDSDYIDIFGI